MDSYTYRANPNQVIPQDKLDPTLFQTPDLEPPKLQQQAKVHILSGIQRIASVVPTTYGVIFGKCLRENDPTTLVNVLVGVDEKFCNRIKENSLNLVLAELNDKYVAGTQHPINFIITKEPYDKEEFDQLYVPIDDEWLVYNLTESYRKPKRKTLREKKNDKPDTDLHDLTVGLGPLNAARKSEFGLYPITAAQAKDIADHFQTHLPKRGKYYKMLGNTKIMMYRPKRNKFLLVKGENLHKKIEKKILVHKLKSRNS